MYIEYRWPTCSDMIWVWPLHWGWSLPVGKEMTRFVGGWNGGPYVHTNPGSDEDQWGRKIHGSD